MELRSEEGELMKQFERGRRREEKGGFLAPNISKNSGGGDGCRYAGRRGGSRVGIRGPDYAMVSK